MNLKKLLGSAGRLARDIAKHEAAKAKKKATAAVRREAKRQVKSVKKQALAAIGIKKKATKKQGAQ